MKLEVIVIGGSAGALDVVLDLVTALPDAVTAPIVLALHRHATQAHLLTDLMARASRRPVCDVEDKQPMQPQTIYIVPPNYHVLIERDRTLALSVDAPVHFSRPSIDVLFESAADSLGAGVLGMLLSGANEDGARGLARIHQAGGVAIIQDPLTAPHATMPAAAVHHVGPGARVLSVWELTRVLATFGDEVAVQQEGPR